MFNQSQNIKYVTPIRSFNEKGRPLLLTNIVKKQNPNNTIKILKIVMPIIFFLFIWSVIQCYLRKNNFEQPQQIQQEANKAQQQKGKQEQWSNQIDIYLNKLIKLNPALLVPGIEKQEKIEQAQRLNMKLLAYSQEISFYQQLKRQGLQTKQFDKNLKQYISSNSKRLTLTIVKHQKLTSPINKKGLVNNLFRMFKWKNDQYEGIEEILKANNQDYVWKASGNLLAVSTEKCFRPKGLFLTIPEDEQSVASKVHIFGLALQSQSIAANKSLVKSYLGSHLIKKGKNYIPCSSLQCHELYSILIVVLDPMVISNLQLFERIKQI